VNIIKNVALRELYGFFSSFTALGFFAAFLTAVLFIFFWIDPFFVRNSADMRPIFDAMPTLLIFLSAALTMRMWSEERRSGTVEFLLTCPVSNFQLVMGKFVACLCLVAISLALTLPLPVSIALFGGPLDWGPTIGGYLASIFLAAAYVAIGLSISVRTENQIVSLLVTAFTCSLFLTIGSPVFVRLFSVDVSEILSLLGTGSRFESITRGVIDCRDLYYYLSLTGVFLSLNVIGLERLRWAGNRANESHRRAILMAILIVANFVVANFWLERISFVRIDLTEGQLYSLSPATKKYLLSLKEPLLIRGYFSKRMHPRLQVVVPRLKDLLKEYQACAPEKVRVEFLDPQASAKIEKEAVENYGIMPVPFQSANKYQSSLVNAYFDVVLQYGGQYQKLNWTDLIEVSTQGNNMRVDLRNPEYDITRAINKLVSSYRSTGNVFVDFTRPVFFVGYFPADNKLPGPLRQIKKSVKAILEELKNESKGKFSYSFQDPADANGALAKQIATDYGYQPMSTNRTGEAPFFFYMLLKSDDKVVPVPLASPFATKVFKQSLEEGLRKFSKDFLKTIGIYQGLSPNPLSNIRPVDPCALLTKRLTEEYSIRQLELKDGEVPPQTNLLLLIAPERFQAKEVYAVDQFLMRGGTVVILTSPFSVDLDHNLSCTKTAPGLLPWLESYGLEVEKTFVLDTQNFPFVLPTKRMVDKTVVAENTVAPYPYSVDVAKEGLVSTTGITAGIRQLLFSWCAPVVVDQKLNNNRQVFALLRSSPQSWTSSDLHLNPQYSADLPLGFKIGSERGARLLAVAVQGKFDSYFDSKEKPNLQARSNAEQSVQSDETFSEFISRSPESARIILFSSNTFAQDKVIYLTSSLAGALSLDPVHLIQNAIDWSLDDRELLHIRSRGNFSRALYPPGPGVQMLFEYMNYGFALAGLLLLFFLRRFLMSRKLKRLEQLIQTKGDRKANEVEECRPQ